MGVVAHSERMATVVRTIEVDGRTVRVLKPVPVRWSPQPMRASRRAWLRSGVRRDLIKDIPYGVFVFAVTVGFLITLTHFAGDQLPSWILISDSANLVEDVRPAYEAVYVP